MAYAARHVDGISIVDLDGEIDLYKSPDVRAVIGKLIARKEKSVAINFQKVSYIDSSGLATIIDAFQKMRAYGGKLVLVSLAKPVRSVFEVARLDKFFPIYDEETAAVASLRDGATPAA
jgi:anti-sigma B factor antagonist